MSGLVQLLSATRAWPHPSALSNSRPLHPAVPFPHGGFSVDAVSVPVACSVLAVCETGSSAILLLGPSNAEGGDSQQWKTVCSLQKVGPRIIPQDDAPLELSRPSSSPLL